jgi:hypothetical protein
VRRKALLIWRGTGISNPSPSSGESRANLTSSIRPPGIFAWCHSGQPAFDQGTATTSTPAGENAMARYCSAQDNVRTRQSPPYRETIRVNVLHGRKSMSWAKSVLLLFTGTSSETLRKVPDRIPVRSPLRSMLLPSINGCLTPTPSIRWRRRINFDEVVLILLLVHVVDQIL